MLPARTKKNALFLFSVDEPQGYRIHYSLSLLLASYQGYHHPFFLQHVPLGRRFSCLCPIKGCRACISHHDNFDEAYTVLVLIFRKYVFWLYETTITNYQADCASKIRNYIRFDENYYGIVDKFGLLFVVIESCW